MDAKLKNRIESKTSRKWFIIHEKRKRLLSSSGNGRKAVWYQKGEKNDGLWGAR